jgi:hypothetical protein
VIIGLGLFLDQSRQINHLAAGRGFGEGQELRRRMHTPVHAQHRWLCSVLRGHDAYYGLPSNWPRMDSFHDAVRRRWYRVLRRRSQRRLTWEQFNALLERFPLPSTRITHPREVSLARVG